MQSALPAPIQAAWIGLCLIYSVASLSVKRNVRQEAAGSRTGHLITMMVATALLFFPEARPGPLGWRMAAPNAITTDAGVVLTIAGVLFSLWARFYLGSNWSSIVAIKQGHQLIRTGPYAVVRNPIYSGFLLGMLGTAIAVGEAGCFMAVVLALATILAKAQLEESFLAAKFGEDYQSYRRQVKVLIPFVL
jgi:protein-S-isoprenylcysteine O-methyltransferase Ste14